MSIIAAIEGAPNPHTYHLLSNEKGVYQAANLGRALIIGYGLSPANTSVATSPMMRSVQTAQTAGFGEINTYDQLAEVSFIPRIPNAEKGEVFTGQPPEVLAAAAELIRTPLPEKVWLMDDRLLAGLCQLLEVEYDTTTLLPTRCKPIELPIQQDL